MAINFKTQSLGVKSFGKSQKTNSTMQQASRNLSTSSGTVNNAFSFRGTRRGGWVPGQDTITNRMKYNFQDARARLNPRTYEAPIPQRVYSSTDIGTTNIKVNGGSDFMKGQIIGGLVGGALQGVFGLLNSQSLSPIASNASYSKQLDAATGAFSGVSMAGTVSSAAAQNAITSMENATDSATLRGCITSAQSELANLQAANKDGKLQQEGKAAENNMKELQDSVAKDESKVTELTNQVTNGEQQIKALGNKITQLKGNVGLAENAVEETQGRLDEAQGYVTKYDSLLSSMALDDPKRAEVQANLDAAKQNVTKYTQELEKKNAELEQARNSLGDNKEKLQQAEAKLEQTKKDVASAKEELKTAQDKLKESKEKLAEAKEKISAWQNNSKDIAGLEKAIAHHQARLEKLVKQEQKEYDKLGNQIAKDDAQNSRLLNNIDSDGKYSKRELKNMAKIQQNNAENEARRTRAAELKTNLAATELAKQTPIIDSDGNAYKQYTYEGQTYYSRNDQLITEEQFMTGTNLA